MHDFLMQWTQYALFPFGWVGQYIVGKKKAWGYLLSLGTQALWVWYAFAIGKPGISIGSLFYAGLYVWNWWKWRRDEQRRVLPQAGDEAPAAG